MIICFRRRCAIVTFFTPEVAIRTHMKNDEVRLGPKGKAWTRVFYMQGAALLVMSAVFFFASSASPFSQIRARNALIRRDVTYSVAK
jgi:hypothetical protein